MMRIRLISTSILIASAICCCYYNPIKQIASQSTSYAPCDQEILDQTFVTACGPNKCERLLEDLEEQANKNHGVNDDLSSTRAEDLSMRLISQDEDEWPRSSDEIVQISSSRGGQRFKITRHKTIDTIEFFYEECHINGTIFVDPQRKYQRILGFGTTLTDAACKNVDDLPVDVREKLLVDYFSPKRGLAMNLLKIPIGSTRFSYTNYVLEQLNGNQPSVELSSYDTDHRVPIVKDAMRIAGRLKNRIKLLAYSPTAPARMKDNNKLIYGGSLRQDSFTSYANYLIGFLQAYRELGLNIWSLIVSEAPSSVLSGKKSDDNKMQEGKSRSSLSATNESLDYNSMSMGPMDVLKLSEELSKVQSKLPNSAGLPRLLLLGDDKSYIPVWADQVFGSHSSESSSSQIVTKFAGIAYKCASNDPSSYDTLVYATRRYPNKYLIASEATLNGPQKLGSWQYAENYAIEIIKNLEFGSVGWIDSNLSLDVDGGPVISGVRRKWDAAIIIDQRTANYYRNPMFYAIGHLSRYVPPGSIRVHIDFFSSAHMFNRQRIAFLTPTNYLVVFVMNNNIGPMPVNIGINTRTKIETLLETKSFNTFLFKLD